MEGGLPQCAQYQSSAETYGYCIYKFAGGFPSIDEVNCLCPMAGEWERECRHAWVSGRMNSNSGVDTETLLEVCGENIDCTFELWISGPQPMCSSKLHSVQNTPVTTVGTAQDMPCSAGGTANPMQKTPHGWLKPQRRFQTVLDITLQSMSHAAIQDPVREIHECKPSAKRPPIISHGIPIAAPHKKKDLCIQMCDRRISYPRRATAKGRPPKSTASATAPATVD